MPTTTSSPPPADLLAALSTLNDMDTRTGLRQANGKPALYHQLLQMFLATHGREFSPGFSEALATGEEKTAARLAHTLKSAARMIGAGRLGDMAEALEQACYTGQKDDIERHFAATREHLQELCARLKALVAP